MKPKYGDKFRNRFDPSYYDDLKKRIHNLVSEAEDLPLNEQITCSGKTYSKKATLYYSGVSASVLFDLSGQYHDNIVSEELQYVIENIQDINNKGVFLDIQLLFAYPYTDFAFHLIKAGIAEKRPTIQKKKVSPTFEDSDELDYDSFIESKFVSTQRESLRNLQSIYFPRIKSPNSLQLRFSTTALNLSTLIINRSAYYDSYSYARKNSVERKLASELPLLKFNELADKNQFNCLMDNFLYLWEHPTTLFSEDATEYDVEVRNSLTKIRRPHDLKYDKKTEWLSDQVKQQQSISVGQDQITRWKYKLRQIVHNSTREIYKVDNRESIFIACKWNKNAGSANSEPNKYATDIRDKLEAAIKDDNGGPLIKINLVEPGNAEDLFKKIHETMNGSSHAIILATKDIKIDDNAHCSNPNINYELGYMMKQLNASDSACVLVVAQDGTRLPSNIFNYENVSFVDSRLYLEYYRVLKWIKNKFHTVTESHINNAKKYFDEVLTELFKNGDITRHEYKDAKNNLDKI